MSLFRFDLAAAVKRARNLEHDPIPPIRPIPGQSDEPRIGRIGRIGTPSVSKNVIDARDRFEERAAILEFDAGFSRTEAERRAAIETGYRPETLNDPVAAEVAAMVGGEAER